MQRIATLFVLLTLLGAPAWAESYALTIATQPGVGVTTPQEWARGLAKADITRVKIRSARTNERPAIEEVDAGRGKVYRVTGILNLREQLVLPGGVFTLRETAGLRGYLDRLVADGAESMTAARGKFGLTKEEFEGAFGKLGQPINFLTEGISLAELLGKVSQRTGMKVALADGLSATLGRLTCRDELQPLALGCGLAIALRADGLSFAPEKPRGEPVRIAVGFAQDQAEPWPIGWPSKLPPSQQAPELFKKINVEIDGFTLEEAVNAIAPRLEVAFLWDHNALASARVQPASKQVKLERANLNYGRILDKLLFQARLHGELRVDEAGTVFYWITR